jgi:hypothetical protein
MRTCNPVGGNQHFVATYWLEGGDSMLLSNIHILIPDCTVFYSEEFHVLHGNG